MFKRKRFKAYTYHELLEMGYHPKEGGEMRSKKKIEDITKRTSEIESMMRVTTDSLENGELPKGNYIDSYNLITELLAEVAKDLRDATIEISVAANSNTN